MTIVRPLKCFFILLFSSCYFFQLILIIICVTLLSSHMNYKYSIIENNWKSRRTQKKKKKNNFQPCRWESGHWPNLESVAAFIFPHKQINSNSGADDENYYIKTQNRTGSSNRFFRLIIGYFHVYPYFHSVFNVHYLREGEKDEQAW